MIQNIQNFLGCFLRARLPYVFVLLRFCYQSPFILASKFKKNIHVRCVRVSGAAGENLFGYYDKSPWDARGKRLICLRVPFADRHPSVLDTALIELIHLGNGDIRVIATTRAWNLQQGCRLQWLGPDFQKRVMFNDFRDGRFVAIILDIESGHEIVIDRPVYDVSSDGRTALSLDFDRLHVFRPGYGYDRGQRVGPCDHFLRDDGIWHIDLETGASHLIISLAHVAEDVGTPKSNLSATRFNHIMINPSGTRFMFVYRWRKGDAEFTCLYTANLDGSNLFCLAKEGLISHATWKTDDELLVWAYQKGRGEHYYLFRDKSGVVGIVSEKELREDGHPSYSPCGRYILTDTYGNRARQRRLVVYDILEKKMHTLGAFYAPFRYSGETRCDLHPRWKRDGSQICFDSAFEGKRQVYIADNPLAAGPNRGGIASAASKMARKKVVILQRISAEYRVPFYEGLSAALKDHGIELLVVYGQSSKFEKSEDTPPPSCGQIVRNRYFYLGRRFFVWQPALKHLSGADLIIVQQATRNLINYPLMLLRRLLGFRLAYWGHGRNLQATNYNSLSERIKRVYSLRIDHWFAYSDLSAEIVKSLGYPEEEITSVYNTIDTKESVRILNEIRERELLALLKEYGITHGSPVGVFCSRLQREKRLDFLIECLKKVRDRLDDFHFFVIGDGPDLGPVKAFAETNSDWFHWVGARYGRDKIRIFSLADFQLMPGPVGLHIVESFALLTPLITVRLQGHGPEISYLDNGRNGLITENDVYSYAEGILSLVRDGSFHERLVEGCKRARELYTMENMVRLFADGVYAALLEGRDWDGVSPDEWYQGSSGNI